MTVERLRDILNELAESPYWKQDKESQVAITIENFEANLGGRPYEKVQSVGLGFDWKAGQFRIEPENKLMEVSKRK